jgi:hypothetical protein
MEIAVKALTTCEMSPDGGAISLGFEDATAIRPRSKSR